MHLKKLEKDIVVILDTTIIFFNTSNKSQCLELEN